MRLPALLLALPLLAACASPAAPAVDAADGASPFGRLTRWDAGFDAVVAPDARIERLADGFTWSEGPAWIADGAYLLFTDVPENRMHRWSEADGVSVFLDPSGYDGPDTDALREAGANGLLAEPGGTLLLADSGSRLVARLDLATRRKTTLVDRFDGKRLNSPNDLARRSDGSVFFTDPPYGLSGMNDSPAKELDFNGVYRIAPDGGLHLLDATVPFPNGIALSPDERTLYVASSDPEAPVWYAYALDADGAVSGRRVFADASDLMADDAPGLPDGMTVAADGTVFATGPGGVLVFAPDGTRLGRIETGGAISNCTFGDDGRTLYMTADGVLARVRVQTPGLGFAP
ncbi:SMP-30/gluconolactonase/LRE family protein [Luteimonas sp. FCS-9]|uniref:SMP-30/gluconolactonase/LRE family protein n=1 Tax=Luteimonas sp. FCS-9 TaxID=1547516 RepID=UPI00063E95AC|nr:SMP-30/gluconolactonase/LRE family protein [Luteimonas sp. FCS-9]KLJ00374.1 gluconolactonase [Luteimonas sp. FCS-9]